MGKFFVTRKLDLSFLGDGWADAYMIFKNVSLNESLTLADLTTEKDTAESSGKALELLESHFVNGMGFDGEKLVPIEKEDIGDLPIEVITKAIQTVSGNVDPNS